MRKSLLVFLFLVGVNGFATDFYFLKGTSLYVVPEGTSTYAYLTDGVTQLYPYSGLFLKGSSLYRITGTSFGYITDGVTQVCATEKFFLKGSSLYSSTESTYSYITDGVTTCY